MPIMIWAKILEIMKKLNLLLALAFTAVLFSSNKNDESLFSVDEFFVPCYVNVTSSEYNPMTRSYVPVTRTYYLGEVDYGNHGVNVAACEGRADRFINTLQQHQP